MSEAVINQNCFLQVLFQRIVLYMSMWIWNRVATSMTRTSGVAKIHYITITRESFTAYLQIADKLHRLTLNLQFVLI